MSSLVWEYLASSDGGARRLRRNIDELKAGKTKGLVLISIRHTDSLLQQIRGMSEIEDVIIEHSDITVVGMRLLGTLPNLKHVLAYNAIGDAGMLELRHCTKLESLELYDRSITDDAVAEMQRNLPSVRIATRYDEDSRHDSRPPQRELEVESSTANPDATPK